MMIKILSRTTNFLNRNTGYLILLAIILFGFAIIGFQQDNRKLLENTKQSVDNSNTIIRNLQTGIVDLLNSNDRQTRYIGCLLALNGRTDIIAEDVKAQCEKMSTNVDLQDVTKQPGASDVRTNTMSDPAATNPQPTQLPAPVPNCTLVLPILNTCVKL